VWEGIGEEIRRTGQLFGQPHPASAIPPASLGFNTLVPKMIARKAQKLGISVSALESLLRGGRENLLGALLATGVGAEAWRRHGADGTPGVVMDEGENRSQ
jgi:hypothetical protein